MGPVTARPILLAALLLAGCAARPVDAATTDPATTTEAATTGTTTGTAPPPAGAGPVLPRADLTPGKPADPASLGGTADKVCAKGFTTKSVRPTVTVSEKIKRDRLAAYGIPADQIRSYELDHLVSLTVAGDPTSPANLWPEPWEKDKAHPDGIAAPGTGAQTKDKVETWLHRRLCSGAMTLDQVQHGEATNWAQYLRAATGHDAANDEAG